MRAAPHRTTKGGWSLPTTHRPGAGRGSSRPHGHARQMTVIVVRELTTGESPVRIRAVARGPGGPVMGCDPRTRRSRPYGRHSPRGGASQPTHRRSGCGRACGDRSLGWVTQKPRHTARYWQKLTMRCHRSKPPARAGCTGVSTGGLRPSTRPPRRAVGRGTPRGGTAACSRPGPLPWPAWWTAA
jgi:hypothetical protein